MDICPNCGNPVIKTTNMGRPRIYCSPTCKQAFYDSKDKADRVALREGRRCVICDSLIESATGRARCCSRKCSDDYANQRKQQKRRQAWEASDPKCARCGVSIAHRRRGTVFCSEDCKQKVHANKWMKKSPWYMRQYLYGITPEEYEAMLAAQGGRCAICQATEAGGKGGWHVDHCHNTGKIRGLLCHRCNLMLGHAQDDPDRLRAAVGYLEAHR